MLEIVNSYPGHKYVLNIRCYSMYAMARVITHNCMGTLTLVNSLHGLLNF